MSQAADRKAPVRCEISDAVAVITIDRPERRNALNLEVKQALAELIDAAAADPAVRVIILTGSDRYFVAGTDIGEMATMTPTSHTLQATDRVFNVLRRVDKVLIAAVEGYALGGGCELAMLCDFIIASDTAKFGQPEINLGVAPGIGGSQRLTRAVGKAKAMDMCLTGRMMDAAEAERSGLVSRVVAAEALLDEARAAAAKIAGQSILAVMANKELVNAAFETTLAQGVVFERRLFHSLFAFDDQKEGMAAFVEKRKPAFTGR